MRNRSRLILTGLAATMLLTLAVSTASAGHFRVSEKNFEIIWNTALGAKTDLSFIDNGGRTITCPLTLLGSFTERTIAKRAGADVGRINHATPGTCTAGTMTPLQETLPWEIRYSSFGGTLPSITSVTINIIKIALKYEGGNIACLLITESNEPFGGIIENFEAGGGAENLRADGTRTIELGGFVCSFFSSPVHFTGTALVRNLPGTAEVTLTLI